MLKNLLYLAIFTTFLVLLVVGLNIYHNFTTSTISGDTAIQVIPITPTFDTSTINMLKRRTVVSADLGETIVFPTGVQSLPKVGNATPTEIPEPTIEEEESETPTPTPGLFPPGL